MKVKAILFFLSIILFARFNNIQAQNNYEKKVSSTATDSCECPVEGSAKSVKLRELNVLKNRTIFPNKNDFNDKVTLAEMLKAGDDQERWDNKSAAKIIGYVSQVKPGGVETTNCKSKDKNLRDTHIELVLNPMIDEKNKTLIIEITPRLRKIMSEKGEDWSTSTIRSKYLGRWVEVEGWLLFDFEHANMAENTRPGNIKNWRGTAWELHPITKIKVTAKH